MVCSNRMRQLQPTYLDGYIDGLNESRSISRGTCFAAFISGIVVGGLVMMLIL